MRIGLIGIGNMGYPLLQNLVKNGYNVNTLIEANKYNSYNKCNSTTTTPTPTPTIMATTTTTTAAATPPTPTTNYHENDVNEFINASEIIISVLPKSSVTLKLVKNIDIIEKQKVDQHKIRSKYWLDLCSSSPQDVVDINKILSENNIKYMDAPVSGGPKGMRDCKLSSIVSGPEEAYTKLHNIISLYSSNIYYVSEKVSTSSTIKLANNTLLALNLVSVGEIMNELEKQGIDCRKAIDFINTSSGRSHVTMQRYPDHILNESFDYGFSFDLHKKDVLSFLDVVDDLDETKMLKTVGEIYRDENSNLHEAMDHTEIVKVVKKSWKKKEELKVC